MLLARGSAHWFNNILPCALNRINNIMHVHNDFRPSYDMKGILLIIIIIINGSYIALL